MAEDDFTSFPWDSHLFLDKPKSFMDRRKKKNLD